MKKLSKDSKKQRLLKTHGEKNDYLFSVLTPFKENPTGADSWMVKHMVNLEFPRDAD